MIDRLRAEDKEGKKKDNRKNPAAFLYIRRINQMRKSVISLSVILAISGCVTAIFPVSAFVKVKAGELNLLFSLGSVKHNTLSKINTTMVFVAAA